MKLIYVAGIEHCGSTLTDYLLSRHPAAIGLGEVASFFSPEHMKLYLQQWGSYPDARQCSCGKSWEDCEFWAPLLPLNGAVSKAPMIEKYQALLQRVATLYGDGAIVVDSSKSLAGLNLLVDNRDQLGLQFDGLLAVLAIKDVRGFAASMLRKEGAANSLRGIFGIFKRWRFRNGQFFDFFEQGRCRYYISLYENLCADPARLNHAVFGLLGCADRLPAHGGVARSHIAMGNKRFVANFDGKVSYDDAWKASKRIRLAYFAHPASRRFNERLYALACDGTDAEAMGTRT